MMVLMKKETFYLLNVFLQIKEMKPRTFIFTVQKKFSARLIAENIRIQVEYRCCCPSYRDMRFIETFLKWNYHIKQFLF